MQGGHCPACGAAQTGYGCGCFADATETAVLPQVEGPPLVRPYVPAVSAAAEWSEDLYGTAVLPAMPAAPPGPPTQPPAPAAAGPMPYIPTQPTAAPSTPRELGLYPLSAAPQPAPGRVAARRGGRHRAARLAVVGAGAGVVALGVGLAFALGSPPDVQHDALVPLPTSVPDQAPTGAPTPPPTSAPPTLAPSSPPATSAKPSASASRSRPAARPTTQTPVSVTSAPAPSAPAPSSAPPSPSSPPPSPSAAPSTSAPAQTLSYSDRGPQVTTLQHQLMTAGCGRHLNSGVYDDATEQAVVLLQEENQLWQDQWGVYGPQTRAALESGTTC